MTQIFYVIDLTLFLFTIKMRGVLFTILFTKTIVFVNNMTEQKFKKYCVETVNLYFLGLEL